MATIVADPGPEVTGPSGRGARRRAWAVRLTLVIASGLLLALTFPPRSLWWLAPVAFAGLGYVLRDRRFFGGLGYGFAFGLAFFLFHLLWIEDFLGRDFGSAPWLALSGVMALYYALASGLVTFVTRLPGAPVWMALVFLLQEALRSRFPINGFPWGRVGFGQPEGAFLSLASIGGAPLVGVAVLTTGFALGLLVAKLLAREFRVTALAVYTLVPVLAGLLLWPTIGTDAQNGTRTVAIVQGNAPDVGLGLLGQREVIRVNHVEQTERLIADIGAGRVAKPDLVVWPETATEVRSGRDPVLNRLVDELGVPTLVGALIRHPDRSVTNSIAEWLPGTGLGEQYAKQELVPFAEYVPLRDLARLFTPFVDDTGDMRAGDTPGMFTLPGSPDTKVALAICYEAAYDYVSRDAVNAGGELLVLPTNNAWYGPGEMSYQQLAMARLRAVEHGRAVIVAATSGVSAVVRPDGSVATSTGLFTAASLVESVPLRATATLSDRLGAWTERGLVALALAGVLAGAVSRARSRRSAGGDKHDMEDTRNGARVRGDAAIADDRSGAGGDPDLQRAGEPGRGTDAAAQGPARGARPRRRRRQSRRHG